jgi:Fe-S-cluster containining protein
MNTTKTIEVTAFAYALIELLLEKGLLSEEELNERKKIVADRLSDQFRKAGMGVLFQDSHADKYTFSSTAAIDCENRVQLCKAACCRLAFALSRQDVEEGIVKWNFEYPYMNARDKEGYCVHLQRNNFCCAIYKNRPVPCRGYDCRNDKRIWLDFEKKEINPKLDELFRDKEESQDI